MSCDEVSAKQTVAVLIGVRAWVRRIGAWFRVWAWVRVTVLVLIGLQAR